MRYKCIYSNSPNSTLVEIVEIVEIVSSLYSLETLKLIQDPKRKTKTALQFAVGTSIVYLQITIPNYFF